VSETQVVLELTGILVYQLVRGAGCLDIGQARDSQLMASHTMTSCGLITVLVCITFCLSYWTPVALDHV